MGGTFQTSDEQSNPSLKPLRVASRKEGVYEEAKNMVTDLAGWTLVRADDAAMTIVCTRKGGLLGGASTITITVEGPEGIPSAIVSVKSDTQGGLPGAARDRQNVLEFLKPFHRRVC
jgi:hypothetical protein